MTNRERILNKSIYDLIMDTGTYCRCKVQAFGGYKGDRCEKYGSCEACVEKWLNEEAKYDE
jgi:hypothetical protein